MAVHSLGPELVEGDTLAERLKSGPMPPTVNRAQPSGRSETALIFYREPRTEN
jgi:hypothetical protein